VFFVLFVTITCQFYSLGREILSSQQINLNINLKLELNI